MRLGWIVIAVAGALAACAPPDQHANLRKIAEQQLAAQGYDPGPQDGVWDAQSAAALRSYTADWGLPPAERLTWVHYVRLTRASKHTRPQWRPTDGGCMVWDSGPSADASASWTGACVDGRASGEGILTFRFLLRGARLSGSYQGAMAGGKRHGPGRMTWGDGGQYDGDWAEDLRSGRGTYNWPDGAHYEGDWLKGDRHGRGHMTWAMANPMTATGPKTCGRGAASILGPMARAMRAIG